MTQTTNRMMDEFAKLMNDAAGVAQGFRREAETLFKSQAERFLGEMDLVQREEFDAMREAALKALAQAEALGERVDALEARVAKLEGTGGAKGRKPAARARAEPKAKAAASKSAKARSAGGKSSA